jgi:hypothetical protein
VVWRVQPKTLGDFLIDWFVLTYYLNFRFSIFLRIDACDFGKHIIWRLFPTLLTSLVNFLCIALYTNWWASICAHKLMLCFASINCRHPNMLLRHMEFKIGRGKFNCFHVVGSRQHPQSTLLTINLATTSVLSLVSSCLLCMYMLNQYICLNAITQYARH